MYRLLKNILIALGLAGVALMSGYQAIAADEDSTEFMDSFDLEAAPYSIVVERDGKVWFTLPDQNALGSLVVTTTVDYQVQTYPLPNPDSHPYDLLYDEDQKQLWFTELKGNRIGRFDIQSETIDEFVVPTAASEPTGIAQQDNGTIWFSQRAGNKLASFDPNTQAIDEYEFPHEGAEPEDVIIQNQGCSGWNSGSGGCVWVTAPPLNRVYFLEFSSDKFTFIPAWDIYEGYIEEPWHGTVDAKGVLWITTREGSRFGRYVPGTFGYWKWYLARQPDAGTTALAYRDLGANWQLWYANTYTGEVGQLVVTSNLQFVSQHERSLAPSTHGEPEPVGVTVENAGSVWIADRTGKRIVRWSEPYFRFFLNYAPSIQKGEFTRSRQ